MQSVGPYMRPVASSFPLQLLLGLSIYFAPVWWALTFAVLIYKGTKLPYPPTALGFEIATTFLVWFIQYWAVRLGKRGNLTEQTGVLGVGVLLLVVALGGIIFFAFGQTYVTRLDLGFSVTFLVIDGLAVLLAIIAMQGFGGSAMPTAFAPTASNPLPFSPYPGVAVPTPLFQQQPQHVHASFDPAMQQAQQQRTKAD